MTFLRKHFARRGSLVATVACLMLAAIPALGDYLDIRRPALLKAEPVRAATTVASLQAGTLLQLLASKQSNGYYHAQVVPAGPTGWVYRTLVRRHRGTSPGAAIAPVGPAAAAPAASLEGGHRVFFGNLHSHTSYSDGSGTPEEAYAHARAVGLDFLAVTEHNHRQAEQGAKDRTDGILIATDPDLYNGTGADSLISAATRHTLPGQFIALYGQEFSSISKGNHVNVFEVPDVIDDSVVPNGRFDKLLLDWLSTRPDSTGQPAIIQFNHPALHKNDQNEYGADDFASGAEWMAALAPHASLIEVLNGPAMARTGGNRPAEEMEADYLDYLNRGFHLAPTADQDNHYRTWGDATEARTAVITDTLTKEKLLGALRARHVYATQDPNLEIVFLVNGHLTGERVAAPAAGSDLEITYQLRDVDEPSAHYDIVVFSDRPGGGTAEIAAQESVVGDTSGWQEIENVRYAGGTQYVLLRITQAGANDELNDLAWTAPVWLEPGQPGSPLPTATPLPAGSQAFVASRFSRLYHVNDTCSAARLIKPANRISGPDATLNREQHQGCPR